MTRILNITYTATFAALIRLAYWLDNLDGYTRFGLAVVGLTGLMILYSYNIFKYLNK